MMSCWDTDELPADTSWCLLVHTIKYLELEQYKQFDYVAVHEYTLCLIKNYTLFCFCNNLVLCQLISTIFGVVTAK